MAQVPNDILNKIEWKQSAGGVPYEEALAFMEARVEGIIQGREAPCVWFLEHPPLYTAGTSANLADLLDKERFPIFEAGRGGEYTYHGPGQLVAYVMMDLKQFFAPNPPDLRAYIKWLESWIIRTLSEYGIKGFVREGRVGVWTENPEEKIAAIGVRVRKWVSFHGLCLNVAPDLSHYAGIVPCGIKEYGVTSFKKLGMDASLQEVQHMMQKTIAL